MKKRTVVLGVILIALTAFFVIVTAGRDDLIVETGIRAYRRLKSGCTIAEVIGAAAFAVSLFADLAAKRSDEEKQKKELAEEEKRREALREADASLSVKGKLDSPRLRSSLQAVAEENPGFTQQIYALVGQLDAMDSYQARLAKLLRSNGADALSDTEEILDRVEQYICRNVRKVLNYAEVLNLNSPSDAATFEEKVKTAQNDNAAQLQKTQEFLLALTEFLNRQGDSAGGTDLLETYKQTILESLR